MTDGLDKSADGAIIDLCSDYFPFAWHINAHCG